MNIFNQSPANILVFIGIFLLTLAAGRFFIRVVFSALRKSLEKTGTRLDNKLVEALETPVVWLFYVVSGYVALLSLEIHNSAAIVALKVAKDTLTVVFITWLGFRLVDAFDAVLEQHLNSEKEKLRKNLLIFYFFPMMKRAVKTVITFVALVIVIQNWGYSVTSLIAGFGITGLAVGFAAKESIANVFGSVFVVADRVYKPGDWIMLDKSISGGSVEGIVEDISLRSTKIRAFDNTIIVIPNNEMANATIKNVSARNKRQISESIDLPKDTPPETIKQAVEICRKVVSEHPEILPEPQIYFSQLGENSLKITISAFTGSQGGNDYPRIRQELLLSILLGFREYGIRITATCNLSGSQA